MSFWLLSSHFILQQEAIVKLGHAVMAPLAPSALTLSVTACLFQGSNRDSWPSEIMRIGH